MTTAVPARSAPPPDAATGPAQQPLRTRRIGARRSGARRHGGRRIVGWPAGGWRTVAGLVSRWTVRLALTLAALAFALLAVGPHVLHYRTMTMLTGSMTGTIDVGDVEIVTPLPVHDVTTGMIIAYHIPIDDHHLVTHRVLDVAHGPDGSVTVQTKGDANPAADPWQATLHGDTAYQVRAVIPDLGHLIELLRTPLISQALVYGAPTLLAGWLLLSIWRPATHPTDQPEENR